MKFDPVRVVETIAVLGDRRFAEPGGAECLADLAAARLAEAGWRVEPRVVSGSRLPWLLASSPSWLVAAALATAATAVIWSPGIGWPTSLLGVPALLVWGLWAIVAGVRCLGGRWNLPPRGQANLVLAHLPTDRSPACRVVLQTPLGPVSALPYGALSSCEAIAGGALGIVILAVAWVAASRLSGRVPAPSLTRDGRVIAVLALALFWAFLAAQALRERRGRGQQRCLEVVDRTGIAVVLELARCWSTARDQKIDLVVAATGGQTLDFAAARNLFATFAEGAENLPTLFLLVIAPGAGETVIAGRNGPDLAQPAARSLWIPHRPAPLCFQRSSFWPPEPARHDLVALIGADAMRRRRPRTEIDPARFQSYAQLVTEIALRWSKRR